MFWFMSRGRGGDVLPRRRHDPLRRRVGSGPGDRKISENLIFLEDPESIEQQGGYVPGGILLCGPPGTGKTLMAEALAGETGKPFVYVDRRRCSTCSWASVCSR